MDTNNTESQAIKNIRSFMRDVGYYTSESGRRYEGRVLFWNTTVTIEDGTGMVTWNGDINEDRLRLFQSLSMMPNVYIEIEPEHRGRGAEYRVIWKGQISVRAYKFPEPEPFKYEPIVKGIMKVAGGEILVRERELNGMEILAKLFE